jgi:hypothetical protein
VEKIVAEEEQFLGVEEDAARVGGELGSLDAVLQDKRRDGYEREREIARRKNRRDPKFLGADLSKRRPGEDGVRPRRQVLRARHKHDSRFLFKTKRRMRTQEEKRREERRGQRQEKNRSEETEEMGAKEKEREETSRMRGNLRRRSARLSK